MIQRMTCPVCERELPLEITSDTPLFPFCCRRCKEVDLFRWMNGDYALVEQLTVEKLHEATERDIGDELPPESL